MNLSEIQKLVQLAVEFSAYVAPQEYGLTAAELVEVGKRFDLREGEMSDALSMPLPRVGQDGFRYVPKGPLLSDFMIQWDPDFRNLEAFQFVCSELRELVRSMGRERACLDSIERYPP